jgi:uncharacterized UBP type Zn finger protein
VIWICRSRAQNRGVNTTACTHLDQIRDVEPDTLDGCSDCLRIGSSWVHLRECLTCGHVGCCDNSPNRHARQHSGSSQHPIIQSFEPGEGWRYCFVDDVFIE